MKSIFAFIIIQFIILNSSYCQKNENSKIIAYQFINEYPKSFNKKEILENISDTVYQYFQGDFRLFQFSKVFVYTLNENLAFEEKRSLYLIYHKDSSTGLLFNFHKEKTQTIVNVDSLLKESWVHNFELSGLVPSPITIFKEEKNNIANLKKYSFQFNPANAKNVNVQLDIKVDSSKKQFLASLSRKWDEHLKGKVVDINMSFQELNSSTTLVNYSIRFKLNSINQVPPNIEVFFNYYLMRFPQLDLSNDR